MNKNYRMAKFININGKYVPYTNDTDLIKLQSEEIERLNKEKSILEKSLKLIWKKDIKIDYEKLDKANKVIEKEFRGDDNE